MAVPSRDIGTLVIVVLKARNLRDRHTFTKQDPYTSVQLGKITKKTEVDKRGGQHPVWDQDLHIPVPATESKETRTLRISCFAKEPREDDLIGAGEIDITETLKTGEFDDWVKLEENGQYRGEVYLEITFFAAGPKPLARRASKLPASERLRRPAQPSPRTSPQAPPPSLQSGRPAPTNASTSPKLNHLTPPRSSHTPSPSSRLDPLPPLPEDVYQPGGHADPHTVQRPLPPVGIPAILKPGGGRSHSHSPPTRPATLVPHTAPQVPPHTTNNVVQDADRIPPTNVHNPPTNTINPSTTTYSTLTAGYPPPAHYAPPAHYTPPTHIYPPSSTGFIPPTDNYAPISFPEPKIEPYNPATMAPQHAPIYPDYAPGSGGELVHNSVDVTAEQERLAKRYGSPLPVPGGDPSSVPTHAIAPSTTPSQQNSYTSRPIVASPLPSHSTPKPMIEPDPYLEREREALSRASQEEADAELARSLAQQDGVDLERLKREEADRELARKLARELNAPIIENERRKSTSGGENGGQHVPGGWNGRSR